MATPVFFGVRHLSPAAAHQIRKKLDEIKPDLILVEGPSDLNDQMHWFCHPKTKLPAAILAYTEQMPIKTLLYPFAEYSPEYQAILWANENKIPCRFMDLPSHVFLAISEPEHEADNSSMTTEVVYNQLETMLEESHDTFWERKFEQLSDGYLEAAEEFGRQLRLSAEDSPYRQAENHIRESYMKRCIVHAQEEGYETIFCVCGAYHVEGLKHNEPLSDEEEKSLPSVPSNITLMPYSYYRLSQRSGYGAGNMAPAYFELLWKALCSEKPENAGYEYLTRLAAHQRKQGHMVSAAEVIEAMRLARTLAYMRSSRYPVLQDLRDAAITCMGHGQLSELSVSIANVEIGLKIGELPDGVSRTSIQDDFYRNLKELKLEKYRSPESLRLDLDLRENLKVKSEKSAFLDLNRSFFLQQLRVLDVRFGTLTKYKSDAVWGESWFLSWTPEAEIELVEAALLGETVKLAALYKLKDRADNCTEIAEAAKVFEDAFLCGIPKATEYALSALQMLSIDTAAIEEIAKTAQRLSYVIRYGDLRKFASDSIEPLLSQLFLRACLILESSCICDDEAAKGVMESIDILNRVQIDHDFLDETQWISLLETISNRDDINTKCSGFAMATLIERGLVDETLLSTEVSRRLSKGVPADLGAGWFEGLAQKNRYSLIMRLSLWRELDGYLSSLDEEEFKRALVFLRRAFSDFSPNEKSDIAENLGEIWGLEPEQTANILMSESNTLLDGLDDFDFGDI